MVLSNQGFIILFLLELSLCTNFNFSLGGKGEGERGRGRGKDRGKGGGGACTLAKTPLLLLSEFPGKSHILQTPFVNSTECNIAEIHDSIQYLHTWDPKSDSFVS